MAHIDVGNDLPGIVSLLMYDTETAKPLTDLAQTILRRKSSLSQGERELIASYVSYLNGCKFCNGSHRECAAILLNDTKVVDEVEDKGWAAAPNQKMMYLLQIAGQVQRSGKHVTTESIMLAKKSGATDQEIHDTVLIAAAFCMYNRYVDGLATFLPDAAGLKKDGASIAKYGYRFTIRRLFGEILPMKIKQWKSKKSEPMAILVNNKPPTRSAIDVILNPPTFKEVKTNKD